MGTVVDIYIKLIIAVLGFVAPTVTLLFPVFFRGITIIKEKLLTQENQFEDLIRKELATIDVSLGTLIDAEKIKKAFKKERLKTQNQVTNELRRSLYFFELKEQIKWIFIPLFLALVYVMLYSILRENIFNHYNINEMEDIGEYVIIVHLVLLSLASIWILLLINIPKLNCNHSPWQIRNNKRWLYLAITFLAFSFIYFLGVKNDWLGDDKVNEKMIIEIYILFLSLMMFFFSVRRLWRIACTVIDAKPMLEESEQERKLAPVSQVPSNANN